MEVKEREPHQIYDNNYYRKVANNEWLCHAAIAKQVMIENGNYKGAGLIRLADEYKINSTNVEVMKTSETRVWFADGSELRRIMKESKKEEYAQYSLSAYKPRQCRNVPLYVPASPHPVKEWIRNKVLGKAPQG